MVVDVLLFTVMVGRYFDKRRSLANGLSVAGSGVGSFLIPPILHFLIERFGIQGCILLLGAFSFHLCIAGMLYRPVPHNRIPKIVLPLVVPLLKKRDPRDLTIHLCPATPSIPTEIPAVASIKDEMYETALYPTRGAGGILQVCSVISL